MEPAESPSGCDGVAMSTLAVDERHRLDPVAVGIADEGRVVAGAVLRPRPGRAVGCCRRPCSAAAWNASTASALGARRQMCTPLSGIDGVVMCGRTLIQNSGYFLPKPMVVGRVDQACA